MTRQTAVLPVLIALVGTVLGFVLGTQSCGGSADSRSAVSSSEQALSPGDTSDLLAPLLAEVRALGDRMADLARSRSGGQTPALTSSRKPGNGGVGEVADASDVTRLLERCTTLIERLERRTQSGGGGALQLVNPLADTKSLLSYPRAERGSPDRFTRDHMLLSYQEILDRYGRPDSISGYPNGKVSWHYRVQQPDGERGLWQIYFLDGRVSGSFW